MIKRALQAGVPVRWFTADEEFGQNPGLREYLEGDARLAYVMAVPKSTEFTDATGRPVTVNDLPPRLAPHAWQRRACGIGTKGYRVYDWAIVDSDQPHHQYMIRRSIDDRELAFYHCFNPRREPVGELVRVAGRRWPVEECFAVGKGHLGLDNYQVRLYHACTGTSHSPCSRRPSSPFSPAAIGRKKGTGSSQPDPAHPPHQRQTHHRQHAQPEPADAAAPTAHPPDPRRDPTPVRPPPPGKTARPHSHRLVDLPSRTSSGRPQAPHQATSRTPGSSPVVLTGAAPQPDEACRGRVRSAGSSRAETVSRGTGDGPRFGGGWLREPPA